VTWLAVLTFALLGLATLGLYWVRHRDEVSAAKFRAVTDSLRVAERVLHDTLTVLGERYRVDTVRVRETTTVYRERLKLIDTGRVVTAHADTIKLDTLAPVKAVVLACTNALATRDTVISVCEQRVAAMRLLFVADSTRQTLLTAHLTADVRRAERRGVGRGRRQGALLTTLALVALAAGLHQLRF
jgi:hypothetical protein